jgi:hypothetical protein
VHVIVPLSQHPNAKQSALVVVWQDPTTHDAVLEAGTGCIVTVGASGMAFGVLAVHAAPRVKPDTLADAPTLGPPRCRNGALRRSVRRKRLPPDRMMKWGPASTAMLRCINRVGDDLASLQIGW